MSCHNSEYSKKLVFKTRLLVFDPVLGNALLNALYFTKKLENQCHIFYSVLSTNCLETANNIVKEICDTNSFFYVPNAFLPYIPEIDCTPRIDIYTNFYNQIDIFRGYYPTVYNDCVENIKSVIDKVNPDYIITSLGSIYIYNVFLANILTSIFPKNKIFLYKDYPYASLNQYNSIKQIMSMPVYDKVFPCNNSIKQKTYLLDLIGQQNLLEKYPNITRNTEVIYNGAKIY